MLMSVSVCWLRVSLQENEIEQQQADKMSKCRVQMQREESEKEIEIYIICVCVRMFCSFVTTSLCNESYLPPLRHADPHLVHVESRHAAHAGLPHDVPHLLHSNTVLPAADEAV